MKKIAFLLLSFIHFLSCTTEETINNTASINIQINTIPEKYKDIYSFNDLKVRVYLDKDLYINENSSFFSGTIDSTGKISITGHLNANQYYYVDIYTEDKVLSNWHPTNLDTDSSEKIEDTNMIVLAAKENPEFNYNISINDFRAFIGKWEFFNYEFPKDYDRATRKELIVTKDFTVKSFEYFNNVNYIFHYEYFSNELAHLYTDPSLDGYPFYQNIKNYYPTLSYNHDDKTLLFTDYTNESIIYKKN